MLPISVTTSVFQSQPLALACALRLFSASWEIADLRTMTAVNLFSR